LPEIDIAGLRADSRVLWVEDVLRYGDLDINRHVNNSVFATLCESGRVNLFRTQFGEDESGDGFFVIARLLIEFKAELHYPGRVRTGTWVRHVGRTSIGLAQVIEGGRGLAATSEAVCVFMSRATGRPAPFSDERRRLATELLRPDVPAGIRPVP
jgi:acyl-CoA thioester hydrolase